MYRICFYYEMLYKLMQFSYDGGQKHQKYEIHFELSIVIHIHYPCLNRPGCNTAIHANAMNVMEHAIPW